MNYFCFLEMKSEEEDSQFDDDIKFYKKYTDLRQTLILKFVFIKFSNQSTPFMQAF